MTKKKEMQGWDCITEVFNKIYPGQEEPLHYGPIISWRFGGNDPLDGISVYDGGEYYHFVSYGFSEVYEKETDNKEYSGFGFELTLKLKKDENVNEEELVCMAGIFQEIGRMTFNNGDIFQPYEYIYTGQVGGIDAKGNSQITGFITVPDEDAGEIITPNGKLEFVQLIGMTDKELKTVIENKLTVKELAEKLRNRITDYNRKDIL